PELLLVSPFLCSDDSVADSESEPAEQDLVRLLPLVDHRSYPIRPRKLLTTRKRVGPFPARRLAWRRASHRSSDHHSSPDFT
ncbi:hypothetical protein Tco_0504534, partial [Tanacetum coccineum]